MGEIETSRLRLRSGHDDDVEGLCVGLNGWSVAQWLVRPPYPYGRDDAQEFIALTRTSGEGRFRPFRIVADRASDLFLGVISLEPRGERAELGYWLLPTATGRGYTAEAAAALIAEGAASLAEVSQIYATTDPDNRSSQAVLHRLSFRFVGERHRSSQGRRASTTLLLFERPMRLAEPHHDAAPAYPHP